MALRLYNFKGQQCVSGGDDMDFINLYNKHIDAIAPIKAKFRVHFILQTNVAVYCNCPGRNFGAFCHLNRCLNIRKIQARVSGFM